MKRALALLLTLVVLCAFFTLLLSADHDCTGENCQICCILHGCLRLTFTLALCALAQYLVLAASSGARVCDCTERLSGCISLITQKVKLSN